MISKSHFVVLALLGPMLGCQSAETRAREEREAQRKAEFLAALYPEERGLWEELEARELRLQDQIAFGHNLNAIGPVATGTTVHTAEGVQQIPGAEGLGNAALAGTEEELERVRKEKWRLQQLVVQRAQQQRSSPPPPVPAAAAPSPVEPAATHGEPAAARRLADVTTFVFYADDGEFTVFDVTGAKIRQEPALDLRDGTMHFVALGGSRGIVVGNAGTAPAEVVRASKSISFIETTEGGGQHVMTMEDRWNPARGFPCTYVRTVRVAETGQTLRTIYTGHARPPL